MNAQQLKNSILQKPIEGRLVPQEPNDKVERHHCFEIKMRICFVE